ncbi:hypothetical protein ACFPRA_12740 [Sporosarcina soli]|uniref:Uncharacterized protein n=1 Tax=Sporosarcina soli TaxID=334736 RepID=A0ABW0TLE8_9BACL
MSKIKVFIEYKVIPEKRKQYLKLAEQIADQYKDFQIQNFSVYEGIEQPNLFVEDFVITNYEFFNRLKSFRLEEQIPFWQDLHSCIYGSASKLNIFAFEEI